MIIDECPLWGQKRVFQLSKPRKTAFPNQQSANWEKSIKIWQNFLQTQEWSRGKLNKQELQMSICHWCPTIFILSSLFAKLCDCILFEEKECLISTSSVTSLMSFVCWWLRDSCLPIPDKAELCNVLPIDKKSIDRERLRRFRIWLLSLLMILT